MKPLDVNDPARRRFLENYTLFIDLDGVLVDFDRGVLAICGDLPENLSPKVMWPRLARAKGFYDRLHWLPDANRLWALAAGLDAIILTGLPLGNWAEAQKRSWCARELGPAVPVITCMSREKHLAALEYTRPGTQAVLVDDRLSLRDAWEGEGGIFIHHQDVQTSLDALQSLFI